jgi:DNA-binding GntR family transcriptional regulator
VHGIVRVGQMTASGGGGPYAVTGGHGRTGGVGSGARLAARRQLPAEVEAYVRELIMTGRLTAGQFIRTDWLAEELGISQTPVREGLLALRGEGFLALEPRRGFRVLELRPSDVEDLFGAQADLAGELARRAAEKLTTEQIEELDAVQAELVAAAERGQTDRVEELNHAFHRAINRSAGSPKLALLLSVAARYVPRQFFSSIEGYPEASARDHRAVLDALHDRDGARAAAAMHRHIEHAGQLLRDHLMGGAFKNPDVIDAATATNTGGPGRSRNEPKPRHPL